MTFKEWIKEKYDAEDDGTIKCRACGSRTTLKCHYCGSVATTAMVGMPCCNACERVYVLGKKGG